MPVRRWLRSLLLLGLLAWPGLARAQSWPDLGAAPVQGGGEHDAALVVGIEKYAFAPAVAGARRNAGDWYAWLTRSRKVPLGRTQLVRDNEATLENLREDAAAAAGQVEPGGTLWVVFIGHGAPARDGSDGVLVGVDAQQEARSLYQRSLPQRELLALLGKGRQARTVVVLDACFSGRTGSGASLAPGLQPLLPVSARALEGPRQVVLTAAQSTEFAGPLPGADRPAFSYLVLGALRGWADQSGDGQVTAEEVLQYTRDALRATVRDRAQTPGLYGQATREPLSRGREPGPDLVGLVLGADAAPAEAPMPAQAPDWVSRGSGVFGGEKGATVVGVGISSKQATPRLRQDLATGRARAEVRKVVEVLLKQLQKTYREAHPDQAGMEQAFQDIRDALEAHVAARGRWVSPSGDEFALASLDVQALEEALGQVASLSPEARRELARRAQQVLADLGAEAR